MSSIAKTQNQIQYYFGYGSNLSDVDFLAWCKTKGFNNAQVTPVTPCWITDNVLHFHYYSNGRKGGAADVIQLKRNDSEIVKGFATPGVLYKVNEEGWTALDRKEGHPNFYKRVEVVICTPELHLMKAITYLVVQTKSKKQFVQPTNEYVGLIENGLIKFNLPLDILNKAKQNWIKPDEDSNVNYIFIYGTLRKTQLRNESMKAGNLVQSFDAALIGEIYNLGSYPGLKPMRSSSQIEESIVYGELYEYSGSLHDILTDLDHIEGYYGADEDSNLYNRMVAKIYKDVSNDGKQTDLSSRETLWAWTYVYNKPVKSETLIKTGDWITHVKQHVL